MKTISEREKKKVPVIEVDEQELRSHVSEVVRQSVEETLNGLLDAETNLKYGVKYLRGAYMVAGGNQDAAVKWYSRGYYYEAKRKGKNQCCACYWESN